MLRRAKGVVVYVGLLAVGLGCAELSAQSVSIGVEYIDSIERDMDGATGFTVTVRPFRHLELRGSKADASSMRVDMLCDRFDPNCGSEQIEAVGKFQSWFVGWRIPVVAESWFGVTASPELGFARLDSERTGTGSELNVRSDYAGIGARINVGVSPPQMLGLFAGVEFGLRGLNNVAPRGEVESFEHRSGNKVTFAALSLGYAF